MLIIFFLWYIFLWFSHPIILSLIVLVQRLIFFLHIRFAISSWLGFAILLIFSGGIIVVFLYITRLSRKLKFYIKDYYKFLIIFLLIFFRVKEENLIISKKNFLFNNLRNLYLSQYFSLIVFIISYVLITLFLCVKVSQTNKGRLTKQYF